MNRTEAGIPPQNGGWQRRKRARPGEILAAALQVFAERGYAATRMDDIAAAAGVTKGTIYLYFSGKEDLFKNLITQTVAQALTELENRQQSYEGLCRDLLIFQLSALSDDMENAASAALTKIIISECGNFPNFARFWSDEIMTRTRNLIGKTIRLGILRGEFRPTDPALAARVALSPILMAAIWQASVGRYTGAAFDIRQQLSTHIDLLLQGLEASHHGPEKGIPQG